MCLGAHLASAGHWLLLLFTWGVPGERTSPRPCRHWGDGTLHPRTPLRCWWARWQRQCRSQADSQMDWTGPNLQMELRVGTAKDRMCLCHYLSLARYEKGTWPGVLRVSAGFVVGSPDFPVCLPASCPPPRILCLLLPDPSHEPRRA